MSGGTIQGPLTILNPTSLLFTGSSITKTLSGCTIINLPNAQTTWDNGNVNLQNKATFLNMKDATFTITSATNDFKHIGGQPTVFYNQGSITMSASASAGLHFSTLQNDNSLRVPSGATLDLGFVSNSATVDVFGQLHVSAGGVNHGIINVAQGATLDFSGGVFNVFTNSSVNVNGSLTDSGAHLFLYGDVAVSKSTGAFSATTTGIINVMDGEHKDFGEEIVISGSGRLNFHSVDYDVNKITVQGAATVDTGCLNRVWDLLSLQSGSLVGTANITILDMQWSGGTMEDTGSTIITQSLNITGSAAKQISTRSLLVSGALNWFAGNVMGDSGAYILNQVNSTFTASANNEMKVLVKNEGLWIKTGSSTTSTFSGGYQNDGALLVQSGRAAFTQGGEHTNKVLMTSVGYIDLLNGIHRFTETSAVEGNGTITYANPNTTALIGGYFEIDNGFSNLRDGSTVNILKSSNVKSMGTLDTKNATLNFFCANAGFRDFTCQEGTEISLDGDISITGAFYWYGCLLTGTGNLIINPTATMVILSPANHLMDGKVTVLNQG